ncbi:hypothetical protein ACQKRQ_38360 [Paraburkholderia sp. NPDC080076]|uniref:hypothetical protein n=1 Tax=Paraburkholderia sp. NPDC080076 TaxID=3390605 RepID=UPI003CFE5DA0
MYQLSELFPSPSIDTLSEKAQTAAVKTVTVMVSNREGGDVAEGTTKRNVQVVLLYGNQRLGPISVASSVDPGKHATLQWSVPDDTADSVRFYWEEKIGIQNVHRTAWFERAPKNLGKPWNALYLGFTTDALNNKPYEVARGGIGFMSS